MDGASYSEPQVTSKGALASFKAEVERYEQLMEQLILRTEGVRRGESDVAMTAPEVVPAHAFEANLLALIRCNARLSEVIHQIDL